MSEPPLVDDNLPLNHGYDGLIAESYDVWLSPAKAYYDVDLYRRLIETGNGPALELGCGNGRLLVKYAAAGLDVEGVDASPDMLAICAAHAQAAGVALVTHFADWLALDLGKRYATLYNPRGSFALIAGDDDARRALRSWLRHLRPGGRAYVSMFVPAEPDERPYAWHVRRSGTRDSDGTTFIVHEASDQDRGRQAVHLLHRYEAWDRAGALVATQLRRERLRWWTHAQMEQLFGECGYDDVRTDGPDAGFLTSGARAT